ncbi:hypothetical protein [Coleofasciculus sp. G3-WIS-01]|uniref:hypothetical protein n=1 Tax=Coleofasciculus sp. G3-WIS-01 TaxID=3069528 RepID=UPI004063C0C4
MVNAFILKITLDLSSYYVLAGRYAPFTLTLDLNLGKLVESYCLLTVIVLAIQAKIHRISYTVIWLFLIIHYVPLLTVYGLSNESRYWMYSVTLFWLFVFCIIQIPIKIEPLFARIFILKETKKNLTFFYFFSFCIIAYAILAFLSANNSYLTINFVDIYNLRASLSFNLPLSNYFINWMGCIIMPFFISFSMINKKYLTLGVSICGEILLFAASGQKTFLLIIPLIIVITWRSKSRIISFSWLALSMATIIFLSSMAFYIGETWLTAIFTNRLLILPAVISFQHYDFFSENSPTYLAHGILKNFVQYPYDTLPWYVIGKLYYGNPHVSANADMISDAYMNFRDFGVFLLAPLFAISLRLIDGFCRVRDQRLVLSMVLVPLLYSLNTSFLTSILTAGFGIAILLLYTIPIVAVQKGGRIDFRSKNK